MPTNPSSPAARFSNTKIVATVGPACAAESRLAELLAAGVDVFRLNMAHGSRAEHEGQLAAIRRAAAGLGRPVGVLIDLAGPKIRLGELPGGQLLLNAGDRLRFVRGLGTSVPSSDRGQQGPPLPPGEGRGEGAPPELTTNYGPLLDELAVGDRIMLADGTVSLVVEQVDRGLAECRVVQPGLIRSRQGVNLPGVKLSVPTLGPADRENALWAAAQGIDFIGLSFVRDAVEVRQLKALLTDRGSAAQVIAKIEKPEAIDRLEEIVAAADGVMVARGDLGVEIDIAQVAVVQKQIVAVCNRYRKPVIIATQMLDSMQHSRLPTRAEVADVANAILDGADACMLSGETAIGEYPREAVEMMERIALATQPLCRKRPPPLGPNLDTPGINQITETTVFAAGRMAEYLDAKLLVVASASGATALTAAKNRNYVPTVGVSDSQSVLRRMCLYWGVIPLAAAPVHDSAALLEFATEWGSSVGLLAPGDRLVLVAGTGLAVTRHNMIVVHQV